MGGQPVQLLLSKLMLHRATAEELGVLSSALCSRACGMSPNASAALAAAAQAQAGSPAWH